jgi:hypothetical protein
MIPPFELSTNNCYSKPCPPAGFVISLPRVYLRPAETLTQQGSHQKFLTSCLPLAYPRCNTSKGCPHGCLPLAYPLFTSAFFNGFIFNRLYNCPCPLAYLLFTSTCPEMPFSLPPVYLVFTSRLPPHALVVTSCLPGCLPLVVLPLYPLLWL